MIHGNTLLQASTSALVQSARKDDYNWEQPASLLVWRDEAVYSSERSLRDFPDHIRKQWEGRKFFPTVLRKSETPVPAEVVFGVESRSPTTASIWASCLEQEDHGV